MPNACNSYLTRQMACALCAREKERERARARAPALVLGFEVVLVDCVQVKSLSCLPAIGEEALPMCFQGGGGGQPLQGAPPALHHQTNVFC